MSELQRALFRFVRVAMAVIIAGIIVQYSNNSYYLFLAPLITAIFKYLRDKFGLDVKIL